MVRGSIRDPESPLGEGTENVLIGAGGAGVEDACGPAVPGVKLGKLLRLLAVSSLGAVAGAAAISSRHLVADEGEEGDGFTPDIGGSVLESCRCAWI